MEASGQEESPGASAAPINISYLLNELNMHVNCFLKDLDRPRDDFKCIWRGRGGHRGRDPPSYTLIYS